MSFRYKQYKKENLRCFVDTATRRCTSCITTSNKYSLFILEEDQERVQAEKRKKYLELTYSEEQTTQLRRKLLEVKAYKYSYTN